MNMSEQERKELDRITDGMMRASKAMLDGAVPLANLAAPTSDVVHDIEGREMVIPREIAREFLVSTFATFAGFVDTYIADLKKLFGGPDTPNAPTQPAKLVEDEPGDPCFVITWDSEFGLKNAQEQREQAKKQGTFQPQRKVA